MLRGHNGPLVAVLMAHDGKTAVSISSNGELICWRNNENSATLTLGESLFFLSDAESVLIDPPFFLSENKKKKKKNSHLDNKYVKAVVCGSSCDSSPAKIVLGCRNGLLTSISVHVKSDRSKLKSRRAFSMAKMPSGNPQEWKQ